MKKVYEENFGEVVCCDFCNEGEETMGGCLIGSYAVCGKCSEKLSHPEEVDRWFPKDKTFRENVLDYRREVYGTADAIMVMFTP